MRSSRSASLILVVGVAVLAGCAVRPVTLAQPLPPPAPSPSPTVSAQSIAASEELIESLVDPAGPGCSAAVAFTGNVVWAGAAGLANLATGTPDTTSTRFDIASVSKQFTATAILMLQRQGLLSLSDPIAEYVDGLPAWGQTITLDQLMHHTSHIPDYWIELDRQGIGFSDAADQTKTVRAIARTKLTPGTGYEYSNSNYVLLAEVVGRVSGQPLPQFLADNIFTPLALDMVVSPTLHAPDIALSYDDDLSLQEGGWTAYGHTGIITTPSELARWGDQYRSSDIIQRDYTVGASYEGAGEYYGAGIDLEVDGDLNHNGRWGGYRTAFTVSSDRKTVVVVMCNGHLSPLFPIADALWKIWDPTDPEAATGDPAGHPEG
ncbi:MAG: serine hydrolase domain-containing protein [Pseudolysinimonas sp.]|uniref:serine hydrolase domain-containing protein n=1 Tax=Pseudolysinimonas sp. TaxID=2680009 RepID=UPI00326332A6